MAKSSDVLAYMSVMDDRNDYPHKRFKMFKLFLKKHHPKLHQLYFVPAWVTAGFAAIWLALMFSVPEFAMSLLPVLISLAVVMTVNGLICQYIGVSRLLDSGLIDDIDPEHMP